MLKAKLLLVNLFCFGENGTGRTTGNFFLRKRDRHESGKGWKTGQARKTNRGQPPKSEKHFSRLSLFFSIKHSLIHHLPPGVPTLCIYSRHSGGRFHPYRCRCRSSRCIPFSVPSPLPKDQQEGDRNPGSSYTFLQMVGPQEPVITVRTARTAKPICLRGYISFSGIPSRLTGTNN